jgi:site-specific recombinase XerD
VLKKKAFKENEIPIYDDAVVYKRGEYWHFRLWLTNEGKYARKSLRTRSESTAIEKGKAYYLEIIGNQKAGKTYFSLTTKEGVQKYIDHRQKDVTSGVIVTGRLSTIKAHLNHFLDFIGKDAKLKELERTDCEDYYQQRSKGVGGAKQTTIQNEQSTINACMTYLFKNNEVHIDKFDFKKLPKIDRNNEDIRRATFTNDEYKLLYKAMRVYCSKSNADIDEDERLLRNIVRYYILIAANSGLRVGEQRQLRWKDVTIEERGSKGKKRMLAKIEVRAKTSKVRRSRILYCRGGEHFQTLKTLTKPVSEDSLVFSFDGEKLLDKRVFLKHFHKLVELAGIKDAKTRGLVPYSLRHFMITQRIMSGLTYQHVADMCGTSVGEIEKTYFHLNDEIRVTSALADYKRNSDGTIEPI